MNCLMDLICNVCRSSSGPTTVHIIKSSNSIRKTDILFSNVSLSHYLFARLMIQFICLSVCFVYLFACIFGIFVCLV